MDIFSIVKYFTMRLSAATGVGLLILLYMKAKLDTKADRKDVEDLRREVKSDFSALKTEIVEIIRDKLDSSFEVMSVTVDKLQGIVDVQIKSLNEQIKRLEEK